MAAAPEYRLAIAYLLLLRFVIFWILSPDNGKSDRGWKVLTRRTGSQWLVAALFILPPIAWAYSPYWLGPLQINPHPSFRWLALLSAAAAILLASWTDFVEKPTSESSDGSQPPNQGQISSFKTGTLR